MSAAGKGLLQWLRDHNLDDYGATIPGEKVREALSIEMPEYGTYRDFQSAIVEELEAVSYVRKVLLNEGKYLRGDKGSYRVLLPSENASQVQKYMEEADRKIKRGLLLSRTTPVEHKDIRDDTEVRAYMRQQSIKESRTYGRPRSAPPANATGDYLITRQHV
jgi:hypothetical protein